MREARARRLVRALLAKAESTIYPHEAEALYAKVAELRKRHGLDGPHPSAEVEPEPFEPCLVQHRARSGEDWSDPKRFTNRAAARAYIRKTVAEARPDFEAHLLREAA